MQKKHELEDKVIRQFKREKTFIRDFTKMLKPTNLSRLEIFLNDYANMTKLELMNSGKTVQEMLDMFGVKGV